MSDVENRLVDRLERLEQQVAILSERLGVTFDDAAIGDDAVPAEVVELARAGRRVEAVKLYGELTGADLALATSVVNAIV